MVGRMETPEYEVTLTPQVVAAMKRSFRQAALRSKWLWIALAFVTSVGLMEFVRGMWPVLVLCLLVDVGIVLFCMGTWAIEPDIVPDGTMRTRLGAETFTLETARFSGEWSYGLLTRPKPEGSTLVSFLDTSDKASATRDFDRRSGTLPSKGRKYTIPAELLPQEEWHRFSAT